MRRSGVISMVLLLVLAVGVALVAAQTEPVDPTEAAATVQAAIEDLLTGTAETAGLAATEAAATAQAGVTATAQAEATALSETLAAVTPNLTQTIDAGLQGTVIALTQEARAESASASLAQQGTTLLYVPGGTFEMGTTIAELAEAVRECTEVYGAACQLSYGEDSVPPHEVTLDPFEIERTEVSYAQYVTYLNGLGPRSHIDGCDGRPCIATSTERDTSPVLFDGEVYSVSPFVAEDPAAHVTWYGAVAYCEALERRLPTEAEWELAARSEDGRIYPWGNVFDAALARTRIDAEVGAEPVVSYLVGVSPYGALNMAGNVAEWTADWYSASYYGVSPEDNPTGPEEGTERVLRGGSWDAVPFFARTVHRQYLAPNFIGAWVGFRCAADVDGGVVPRNVTPTPTPADSR